MILIELKYLNKVIRKTIFDYRDRYNKLSLVPEFIKF